eukprot:6729187-Karenia_brevis.AAC.1
MTQEGVMMMMRMMMWMSGGAKGSICKNDEAHSVGGAKGIQSAALAATGSNDPGGSNDDDVDDDVDERS